MEALEINERNGFELQDIRSRKITPEQLDEMHDLAGSHVSLFSKRSLKYKELGLKNKILTEADYREFILQYDTFLKRPVVIIGDQIFIGSQKKTIEALKAALES